MASANGYGKIVTSGSIFSYDMGDVFNSYKGQPGTNITTGANRNYNGYGITTYSPGVFFEYNGYTENAYIPALGNLTVQSIEINNSSPGQQCCPNLFNYTGAFNSIIWTPGQTYSYQIIYKSTSGYTHPNFMYHYEYTSEGAYITEYGVFDTSKQESLGDGWYHAWNTFTVNANAVRGYTGLWYYQYYVADKISIAAVSISPGDTIRPPRQIIPSNTTRTVTEGLYPLISNQILDLTNVSYNSTAQLTFDGTDDNIVTNISKNNLGNNCTFAAVINSSGNASTYNMFLGQILPYIGALYATQIIFSDIIGGAQQTIYSGDGITVGENHYVVCTRTYNAGTNQTTNRIYIDSVLKAEGTFPGAPGDYSDKINIGDGQTANWYPFFGYVYNVTLYNRTLSASEIQQNYQQYKTRFNLN